MVVAKDPRQMVQARQLVEQDWPVTGEGERWLEAYRRYLCGGILGDFEKSDAAADELRGMPVRGFIKSTIGVPA
jgi:hypothetical protein